MKILKYKKIKNKYRVYLEKEYIDLFEDVIINNNLLLMKEIDNNLLVKLKEENNKYEIIDSSISYINKKLRTKSEIRRYLSKKYNKNEIEYAIKELENRGYIDDEKYIKAYIYDKFNLTNDGPIKIQNDLYKEHFDEKLINKYIEDINIEDIEDKLDKLIDKKIRASKNYSGSVLKYKLFNYFVNIGYDKEIISNLLDKKNLTNNEQGIKEYNKLLRKYSTKYSGYELENIIRQKLYMKGYSLEEIKESNQ